MKDALIYIHGKGGSAAESALYAPLFPALDVLGFDYRAQSPWEAREEFPAYFAAQRRTHGRVTLLANSIGAFFSMSALTAAEVDRALFLSPIVDMERLILDMLSWAGATEDELRRRGTIPTDFGETLSWDYLSYVRSHPLHWTIPTHILAGGRDHLTVPETFAAFAAATGATLTTMPDGEHWFHTAEQLAFAKNWLTHTL